MDDLQLVQALRATRALADGRGDDGWPDLDADVARLLDDLVGVDRPDLLPEGGTFVHRDRLAGLDVGPLVRALGALAEPSTRSETERVAAARREVAAAHDAVTS